MPTEVLNDPLPEDYRGGYDRDYLGAWDLAGRDAVVTIAKVKRGKLTKDTGSKKESKLLIWFEGKEKGMVVNITNATTIAGMYGNKPAAWIGKRITIFATTCQAFGKTQDCLRVRPTPPAEKGRAA